MTQSSSQVDTLSSSRRRSSRCRSSRSSRPPFIDRLRYIKTRLPLLSDDAELLAGRFKALADPTRVAILRRLSATDEVCVCELNCAFDLSQPTISHHLKVLRDAGLVESTRRGTWSYYRLVPDAVRELRNTLGAEAA